MILRTAGYMTPIGTKCEYLYRRSGSNARKVLRMVIRPGVLLRFF